MREGPGVTPTKVIAFMFHDVVGDADTWDGSGFPGHAAARYKLRCREFENHCRAIANATPPDAVQLLDVSAGAVKATPIVSVTFDDGGRSASEYVADALEARGWRGHFFITTDYIETATFLTPSQICSLRARGHGIGTHSCSHPDRMHRLSWSDLVREWSASARLLSDLVGEPVTTASVPGGYYTRRVAQAAAAAGIRVLFTSQPTATPHFVEACLVVGRYVITRDTSPAAVARLAAGRLLPQLSEAVWWEAKRMAKALGGVHYDSLRRFLLERMER
jgi:peptidoglycan/xylan/chitin deacetylase (PgdA/CDA1 family)